MKSQDLNPDARYEHLFALCEGIAVWLHPHAEVVLHDLETDTVVRLWNNFSRRQPGDASLIGKEIQLADDCDVYGPYEHYNWDGRLLKSISAVIRDNSGRRMGLLCLNLDVSSFEGLKRFLESFTGATTQMPQALNEQDWREQIHQALGAFLQENNVALEALTRDQKIAAVGFLDSQRLFLTRNAAQHVASILGVSRATVYNWLNKTRNSV